MTDNVGWGSEQDQRPFSAAASGEDGPWARWIPNAWQAVADPDGRHSAPALPMRMGGPGHGRVLNEHAELLAWWGPFTHLLWFGLGWPQPHLGLKRWLADGSPETDPMLALVARWWGPQVNEFVKWGSLSSSYRFMVESVSSRAGVKSPPVEQIRGQDTLFGEVEQPLWFGVDEMHLQVHLSPIDEPSRGSRAELIRQRVIAGQPPRAVLLVDHYQGWYWQLCRWKLPMNRDGRSWRVDVVCEPLGWLGQYRKSRQSGRWFRGQHRWHQLGI